MVLRSTEPGMPLALVPLTKRRPSTSTRVRLLPRYLRSIVAEPAPTPPPSGGLPRLPLALTLVFKPPAALGIRCSTSPTADRPVLSIVVLSRKTTGAFWLSGSRRMREPVMTISLLLMVVGGVTCVTATGVCAQAAPLPAPRATSATPARRLVFNRFMTSPWLVRRYDGHS